MSDSLGPCGLQPARLFSPWNFLGKNTGVGCHSLLQGEGSVLTQGSNLGLLHGRLILYHLSHQGSPENKVFPGISRTDHRFRPLLGQSVMTAPEKLQMAHYSLGVLRTHPREIPKLE